MENLADFPATGKQSLPGGNSRILIADDHSMIRTGLKLYLQMNLGYSDISEVSSCRDLMNDLVNNDYTHLILDIILSDGSTLEVIPNIKRLYPELKILVFSMQPAEVYGEALKQFGLYHYLPKSLGEEEILDVLRKFMNNELSTGAVEPNPNKDNPFATLAPRELEILHYILKGMRTKEIAEAINLKMNTVSTIKTRIHIKTGTENLKDLLELASLYNVNF